MTLTRLLLLLLQGTGGLGGGREGVLPQAVAAVLRHVAVVPRHRYMLTASYCGARGCGRTLSCRRVFAAFRCYTCVRVTCMVGQ